ncbi:TonB-dependent receptor [Porticoccus sp. GXU_MW_L64]
MMVAGYCTASDGDSPELELKLPEQKVSVSLNVIADRFDHSLLYSNNDLKDIHARALSGIYTLPDALASLLDGTSVRAIVTDRRVIVVSIAHNQKQHEERGVNKTKLSQGILAALASLFSVGASAEESQVKENASGKEISEEIVVRGIKGGLISSVNDKRNSAAIKDSITAEDIGQLPDANIAEALQRVTGIQLERSTDGEGTSVQVRGFVADNVEINGRLVSGTADNRSINFQDLPSELFAGIEVLKAPTADKVEGSLGGTVNLKTRRPLSGKEFTASINTKAKYAENNSEYDPDINAFVKKQWRDTDAGDFGVVVNVATSNVSSLAQTYGGGDFSDATGIWLRRTGDFTPPNGPPLGNPNGTNLFAPARGAGVYQFDANVDVNGDGESNSDDVYYIPGQFGFLESVRESDRDSVNVSLQWQPSEGLDFYLDASRSEVDEVSSGARYSINTNAARSAVLELGDNQFERLGTTSEFGDVFVQTSGIVGNATIRAGASPSINAIERESDQLTFGGSWKSSETFELSFEAGTSEGTSSTVQQGALVYGIDFNGNNALTGIDFAQLFEFDLNSGSRIPDVTLYEAPFVATAFGVDSVVDPADLVAIDPSDPDYERLSYFQFNRVASDIENTTDSFRLDGKWELDGAFTELKVGVRYGERAFSRRFFERGNQRGNFPSTLIGAGEDPRAQINIQAIAVNPAAETDPDIRAAAEFLANCQASAGGSDFFESDPSSLPRTFTGTNCTADEISAAFGLIPIREIDPNTGAGVFENAGEGFNVEEDTLAFYVSGNFEGELAGLPLFGNVGVRYVDTETVSAGFAPDQDGALEAVEIRRDYNDFLPSLNANLQLNEDMLLRLGVSRALGRPSLGQLTPGLDATELFGAGLPAGINGTATAGNPNLDPVRANNVDLSYEWYYGDGDLFSVALFYKDIDSTIALGADQEERERGNQTFLTRTFENLGGTQIQGLEISLQNTFDNLDGFWSNTGVVLNYTYTDEDSDLVDQEGDQITRRGLSENSANAQWFYDDGIFSARFAYNWRDEFVRRENVQLGFGRIEVLPEVEAARGQLDFSANYNVTDNLKINFSAVNLNDSETERFLKYEQLTNFLSQPGRRYTLGVIYRF